MIGGTVHAGSMQRPTARQPEELIDMEPHAVVVTEVIDAEPSAVWADVRDISTHVHWMADAARIEFVSDTTEGMGTRFECETKVGPITLTDVMEITAWKDGERMGVRHVGVVTGEGVFTLRDLGDGRTEFRWAEDLTFPWWMAGPVGAWLARPVLRRIWRGNLGRLKQRIESGADLG